MTDPIKTGTEATPNKARIVSPGMHLEGKQLGSNDSQSITHALEDGRHFFN